MIPAWKTGVVAEITHAETGAKSLAIRTDDGRWACVLGGSVHRNQSVRDVRQLLVIDPEDRETIADLLRGYDNARQVHNTTVHSSRINALQRVIKDMVKPPKPEVFAHIVGQSTMGGFSTSLCGKVWQPGKEEVTVIGHCVECAELARKWVS